MPKDPGNEECQVHHYEEWQTCYTGRMSRLRDQDVPDRQGVDRKPEANNRRWVHLSGLTFDYLSDYFAALIVGGYCFCFKNFERDQ
jgi:hypothetical protein